MALILVTGYAENATSVSLMSIVAGPLGGDFANYYTGAKAAMGGHAVLVYDQSWFDALEGRLVTGGASWLPVARLAHFYSYPPLALLLTLPLALLPLSASMVLWMALGTTVAVVLLRRLVGWREAALAMLGAPAAIFNLIGGQNGCFTASLFAGGLMALDRFPLVAGLCFGCLGYKPQLALLLPFALMAGGYWRALWVAAATLASLAIATVAVFGAAPWAAFAEQAGLQRHVLEFSYGYWYRMPTVFATAQQLGAPIAACYAAQSVSAALALVCVVATWRLPASREAKAALLAVAAFLATPYAWDYDAIILIFAAAWLGREGMRTGFQPWERVSVVMLLVLPAVTLAISVGAGLQCGPIVLWLVLLLLVRRALVDCGHLICVRDKPSDRRTSTAPQLGS